LAVISWQLTVDRWPLPNGLPTLSRRQRGIVPAQHAPAQIENALAIGNAQGQAIGKAGKARTDAFGKAETAELKKSNILNRARGWKPLLL